MILSLSHNDLDAFGCQLCILETFNKKTKIEFYNTNYKDFDEKVFDILDRIEHNREHISALIISDISFAEKKNLLLNIQSTVKRFNIKTFFIDHHEYPENFWNDIDLKVIWDINKSASLLTYETLKCSNPKLKTIIDLIDVYDLWKEDQKYFKLAQNLNTYFWEEGRLNNTFKFFENGFEIPKNFLKVCNEEQIKAKEFYEKALEKNLIFSPRKDISFSFTGNYLNYIIEEEFKKHKSFISVTHYGVVRCRFKKEIFGGFSDDKIKIIKNKILKNTTRGHLHSFSFNLDDISADNIIEKFKQIDSIIKETIEE